MPFPAVKPTAAPATAPTGPNTTRPAAVPRAVFTPRPAFAEFAARTRLAAAAVTAMIALMISPRDSCRTLCGRRILVG